MKKKYICVEDYIDRQRAYPLDTTTTLKYVYASLKDTDPADVIPVSFITKWFREHYGAHSCSLVDDWKAQEDDDDC